MTGTVTDGTTAPGTGAGTPLSIVVPTVGRVEEVGRLLDSLRPQLGPGDQLVVIDQNSDDRLGPVLAAAADLRPERVRAEARGASHARNVGLAHVRRAVVWFPDDDGWATPGQLEAIRRCLEREPETDVVAGRIVDEDGRPSMGRWPDRPVQATRGNVWRVGAEATMVFRRRFFERVGGFREAIGVGSRGPWGAGEGQDLLLRGLAAGCRIGYRPDIVFGHPNKFERDEAAILRKAASYARGVGYVMGVNGYSPLELVPHLLKPLVAIVLFAVAGRRGRVRYYAGQLVNRWRGWWAGRRDRGLPPDALPPPAT
ncbi:MAG: glycosyltransferase family A protein [Thalassobaculum sp.]|uniref:glycosyltransferase family 2 protein n=1 Tax=Thalassobaculum sp. TaxID=2022740 RepID=UPI0032EF7658